MMTRQCKAAGWKQNPTRGDNVELDGEARLGCANQLHCQVELGATKVAQALGSAHLRDLAGTTCCLIFCARPTQFYVYW